MTQKPITPEIAKRFTAELDELMKKYDFAFPCAVEIYRRLPSDQTLVANTELLEKLPDNPKYNYYFSVHNGPKEE